MINVNRMRRHIARSTPDRVVGHFDLLSDTLRQDQNEFIQSYLYKMKVKHGPNAAVQIYVDEMEMAKHPADCVVLLITRPDGRRLP